MMSANGVAVESLPTVFGPRFKETPHRLTVNEPHGVVELLEIFGESRHELIVRPGRELQLAQLYVEALLLVGHTVRDDFNIRVYDSYQAPIPTFGIVFAELRQAGLGAKSMFESDRFCVVKINTDFTQLKSSYIQFVHYVSEFKNPESVVIVKLNCRKKASTIISGIIDKHLNPRPNLSSEDL